MKQNKIQAQLMEGLDAQNKGNFTLAKKTFHDVLKSDPNNFAALYSLVVIEINLSNFKDALILANKAVQANSKFTQAYYARALAHYQLGDITNALKDIDKTLELDSKFQAAVELKEQLKTLIAKSSSDLLNPSYYDEVMILNAQASKLIEEGHPLEAVNIFLQVLEKKSDDYMALYSLGFLYHSMGETKNALHFMGLAAHNKPENERTFFALGTIQHAAGLLEDALQSFDRAIEINPKYIDAYNNKVSLRHAMNRQ